ncbi:MAG: HsdR family type I site-specific deoxyribonuclease, partial [Planctomycetia bacterium]|nr:HsdR family type I site-specific deoxyribonuclease [Planctomycetia bacterium]
MDYNEQRERDYQDQIVALFRDNLQYTYLGNLQYSRGEQKNSLGYKNSPLIEPELRKFLDSNGSRQYTEQQIDEAIRQLRTKIHLPDGRPGTLVDINTDVYDILIHGVKAKPSPEESERDVMFIDYNNPLNNHFCIAEEVSYIDPLTSSHSRPDMVVYINGIAVAVIELKRSLVSIEEAIKQQLSNQCDLIPSFFTTTQFTIAASDTNGFQYATINTPMKFWCPYKPDTNETGIKLSDRESFSAFFDKEQFVTFLRYAVLTDNGIKKVMRPHQFHALRAAIPRLKEKASGVIWHSQGSGKSLTMVWLAAYIRVNFENPRVLVITDRTELDKQITSNFTKAGDTVHRATSQEDLLNNLKEGTEWLICTLIHKFGRHKTATGNEVVGDDKAKIPLETYLAELKEMIAARFGENFKAKGKNIFVFIDECHRTQGGRLHEAMRAIMGQDVMLIGFTGTPLLKKDNSNQYESFKNLTETRFGTFIHKYLHKQAVEDGVILDLQYEGRDVDQQVTDKEKLDEKLAEITKGLSDERRKAIEDRWATLERVYSSKNRIERIGYSILDDMKNPPLSESWCNAMLVAGNIESAYKYHDFFQNTSSDTTLKGHCAVVTSYEPTDDDLRKERTDPAIEAAKKFKHDMAKQSFREAGQQTAEQYEAWAKERFIKKPGQMKLLIVVDKLLTGFDAPCATYLYIDKDMRDHNLFQAICRVNRLGTDIKDDQGELVAKTRKEWGLIVDFKHLFEKITDAVTDFNDENGGLSGYNSADIDGLLADYTEKEKRRLLAAKEAYDALKATWHGMNSDELVDYYCTETEELPAKERRQALYKITNALVIAYSNMSEYMGKAGFTQAESNDYHKLACEASQLNKRV